MPIIFCTLREIEGRSESLPPIPLGELSIKEDDTEGIKFAAAAISAICAKTGDEFVESFSILVDRSAGAQAFEILEDLIRKRQLDGPMVRAALLTSLEKHAGDDLGEQLVLLLRGSLDTRQTRLQAKECWCELGFPVSLHAALLQVSKTQNATL